MVNNGKPTWDWISPEESTSPTVSLESIIITKVTDAHEERDEMPSDVPNALIKTEITNGNELVIMNVIGVLAYLLVEMSHEVYV